MGNMIKQTKHAMVYFQMIRNAFRDEENQDLPLERIELKNGSDLNLEIVAMLQAVKAVCEGLAPEMFEHEDLVGFTHILNRLVIQYLYVDDEDDPDDENHTPT